MEVDKNVLTNVYGIDDDNFVDYLNKFSTLKKVINLATVEHLPVEKIRHLYNSFLYYFSLGHNLDTIVDETTPVIKRLFFFNGEGYLRYKLPDDKRIRSNYSFVDICGRISLIRLRFVTSQEITENDCLFETLPSPTMVLRTIIPTDVGSKNVVVSEDGLNIYNDTIPSDTVVSGTIVYPVIK